MKAVMAKETILYFIDFSKEVEIHTDAFDKQPGAVIAQKEKL